MKAAANGVLNCSILDGWWVEGYSPDVGWAIGRGETYSDAKLQDQLESQALVRYSRKADRAAVLCAHVDNVPREWIAG
jgi:starch phosphorylase